MTDPRKQAYVSYLRNLADLMGLKDWEVRIDDRPTAEENLCSVCLPYGLRSAKIRLSEDFLDASREDQRGGLVHELVHLHYAACDGIAKDGLDPDVYCAYQRIWEYAIDGIAEAWAPLLPLPPEGC